ncbi:thiamine-phosphate kinase [Herbaspirillum sp. RTI4]|uniref:thiamine-phosphate kinase n=1 Tax=Herbaspirillum sp. RTI4 TaxID=3048640 RepID=UPI002AB52D00|nr:thiamine-phosphate kinase [Herbaspirillum sp. RTI4]MDY7579859.1 thiamine-phosphate kinase [Herbaspirillum sp. RTI4]MEA9981946.1 thiamine-phosphate kinase [Herbaspirillum sp. RTI4]
MLSEFELIARFFHRAPAVGSRAALGIGDDCALFSPAPGMQLAVSSDMLVEGRHFFADADPALLGHKCLAVNLSDLAAMGAKPLAFTLALALPTADPLWLAPFSQGLLACADLYSCELIGGDTTQGPLNICITIFGEIPPAQALRRDAAQIGDDIWVSGTLGDARLALAGYRKEIPLDAATLATAAPRLHAPTPRVALGLALRGVAHAAIDLSDGLAGDLQHILDRSGTGACINADALPIGPMLRSQTVELQRRFALSGGDDYELCFTAAPARREQVLAAASGVGVTCIGKIEARSGLRIVDHAGLTLMLPITSFDHFQS